MFGWRAGVTGERVSLGPLGFAGLGGQIALDRFGARFRLDDVSWSGGSVRGIGEVDLRRDDMPVRLELEIDGAETDRVLAEHDVDVSGVATRLAGTIHYRFPSDSPLAGEGSIDLDLLPAPDLSGLPLHGTLSARVTQGTISTEAATLRSEDQAILARGTWELPTGRAEIDWEGTTLAVEELVALVPGEGDERWRPTAGRGTHGGTLRIEGDRLETDVQLDLEDVRTPTLPLDRVVGGFLVTPDRVEDLRLELTRDSEALVVSGEIPFDETSIELAVDLVDVDIESMRPWIPFGVPIDGRSSGRIELSIVDDPRSPATSSRPWPNPSSKVSPSTRSRCGSAGHRTE